MIIKVSNKQYHNLWELANNFEYPHHWEAWIAYQVIQILAGKQWHRIVTLSFATTTFWLIEYSMTIYYVTIYIFCINSLRIRSKA